MFLYWQTAQTLVRRRVLRRFIWVYAVCICFFFRMHLACSTSAYIELETSYAPGVLFSTGEERAGCFTLIGTFVLGTIVVCPVGWSVACV